MPKSSSKSSPKSSSSPHTTRKRTQPRKKPAVTKSTTQRSSINRATQTNKTPHKTPAKQSAENKTAVAQQAQGDKTNSQEVTPPIAPQHHTGATHPGKVESPNPLDSDSSKGICSTHPKEGISMRIILIILCLASAALYIKILLPPDFDYEGTIGFNPDTLLADQDWLPKLSLPMRPATETTPMPTVESQVKNEAPRSEQNLRPLPEDQWQLIQDVFAPELN